MDRATHTINVAGKTVGRSATQIATILRGKHKTDYIPHLDCGDIVMVENIKKLKFTGRKLDQKKYYRYSGYPGGLKEKKMGEVYASDPADVLRRAVREMLPPVKFRGNMLKRLIIK